MRDKKRPKRASAHRQSIIAPSITIIADNKVHLFPRLCSKCRSIIYPTRDLWFVKADFFFSLALAFFSIAHFFFFLSPIIWRARVKFNLCRKGFSRCNNEKFEHMHSIYTRIRNDSSVWLMRCACPKAVKLSRAENPYVYTCCPIVGVLDLVLPQSNWTAVFTSLNLLSVEITHSTSCVPTYTEYNVCNNFPFFFFFETPKHWSIFYRPW